MCFSCCYTLHSTTTTTTTTGSYTKVHSWMQYKRGIAVTLCREFFHSSFAKPLYMHAYSKIQQKRYRVEKKIQNVQQKTRANE